MYYYICVLFYIQKMCTYIVVHIYYMSYICTTAYVCFFMYYICMLTLVCMCLHTDAARIPIYACSLWYVCACILTLRASVHSHIAVHIYSSTYACSLWYVCACILTLQALCVCTALCERLLLFVFPHTSAFHALPLTGVSRAVRLVYATVEPLDYCISIGLIL